MSGKPIEQERRFSQLVSLRLPLDPKEAAQRSFYEIEASEQGWTLRELKRHFNAAL